MNSSARAQSGGRQLGQLARDHATSRGQRHLPHDHREPTRGGAAVDDRQPLARRVRGPPGRGHRVIAGVHRAHAQVEHLLPLRQEARVVQMALVGGRLRGRDAHAPAHGPVDVVGVETGLGQGPPTQVHVAIEQGHAQRLGRAPRERGRAVGDDVHLALRRDRRARRHLLVQVVPGPAPAPRPPGPAPRAPLAHRPRGGGSSTAALAQGHDLAADLRQMLVGRPRARGRAQHGVHAETMLLAAGWRASDRSAPEIETPPPGSRQPPAARGTCAAPRRETPACRARRCRPRRPRARTGCDAGRRPHHVRQVGRAAPARHRPEALPSPFPPRHRAP